MKKTDSSEMKRSAPALGKNRRSFLKKGGMVTSGMLVLANRPAMGAACSISGFMSANPSIDINAPENCQAWSPGAWKQAWDSRNNANLNQGGELRKANGWEVANVSGTDAFNAVERFQGNILVNGIQTHYTSTISATMRAALGNISLPFGLNPGIVRHAAAAFLNARFILNYPWGATGPLPWMIGFPHPTDIVGVYLAYEAHRLNVHPGATIQFESSTGALVDADEMADSEFLAFLTMLASHTDEDLLP